MLTPVQQTPLPLDPARQQITPVQPIATPAQPRPAETPVQASANPKDKFNRGEGDRGSDGGQDRAYENQQQAASASRLRAAYLRLMELQRAAGAALNAGDAKRAKQAAQEAAEVAETIHQETHSFSVSGLQAIEAEAAKISQADIERGTGAGSEAAPIVAESASALTLARDGLGTAKDVVDTASMLPQHTMEDRIALSGMRKVVLAAMAGVEEIAAKLAGLAGQAAAESTGHLDIQA